MIIRIRKIMQTFALIDVLSPDYKVLISLLGEIYDIYYPMPIGGLSLAAEFDIYYKETDAHYIIVF